MWRLRTLASQILIGVVGILLATVIIGGALDVHLTRRTLDHQYEERARIGANVVATIPDIRTAVAKGDPDKIIQPLAQRIMASTGASYVVVTDRTGLRFSHPNPALIGKRLEEPVVSLDGHDHVGIDHGSLGLSANGKAPIFGDSGQVIGQVSLGIPENMVFGQLRHEVGAIAAYSAIALAVGVAVALLLTRAVKRVTFGLELREIASLLQEREAMLHGIREGVIGFDAKGRVSLINNEARRLLSITTNATGEPLEQLVEPGRLRGVLEGTVAGQDQTVLTDDALLVVNRRPVVVGGRPVGSIVTLRDRTELEALVRRMNAVTGLTNALRAPEHEFTNRLHVIAGLLDLGETEEARQYLDGITREQLVSAEDLRARIAPPTVAALLLAKMAVAAERDAEIVVTEDSHLDAPDGGAQELMTIIGNLVDNAIDAVSGHPGQSEPGRVSVRLRDDDEILIEVSDNGPGIPPEAVDEIFTDGYSTKDPRGDMRRGLGLALVRRLVHRAGGEITVSRGGPGAHFEVRMPLDGATRKPAVAANLGAGSPEPSA
jgi:two-component system CitB family sensor kinase